MIVYVALSVVEYEGSTILGVFSCPERAWACRDGCNYERVDAVEEYDTENPEHFEEVAG